MLNGFKKLKMQRVSDYELLELALGGNKLRLFLNSDPKAESVWLHVISEVRKKIAPHLLIQWAQNVGKLWDKGGTFHGVITQQQFCKFSSYGWSVSLKQCKKTHIAAILPSVFLHSILGRRRIIGNAYEQVMRDQPTIVSMYVETEFTPIFRHESPVFKVPLERMVKEAIRSWNLLSLRFKVPRDLRQKIAQVIWDSRVEWI